MIEHARPQVVRYVESSAVLALLLREPPFDDIVSRALADADRLVSSVLTIVECRRAILRARAAERLDRIAAESAQFRLSRFEAQCSLFELDATVVTRSSESMGDDRIRTLDAIHVGTALVAQRSVGPLAFVSLDHRVRATATACGFLVLPVSMPLPAPGS